MLVMGNAYSHPSQAKWSPRSGQTVCLHLRGLQVQPQQGAVGPRVPPCPSCKPHPLNANRVEAQKSIISYNLPSKLAIFFQEN